MTTKVRFQNTRGEFFPPQKERGSSKEEGEDRHHRARDDRAVRHDGAAARADEGGGEREDDDRRRQRGGAAAAEELVAHHPQRGGAGVQQQRAEEQRALPPADAVVVAVELAPRAVPVVAEADQDDDLHEQEGQRREARDLAVGGEDVVVDPRGRHDEHEEHDRLGDPEATVRRRAGAARRGGDERHQRVEGGEDGAHAVDGEGAGAPRRRAELVPGDRDRAAATVEHERE